MTENKDIFESNKGVMFVADPIKKVRDLILDYISNFILHRLEIEPETLLGFVRVLNELEKNGRE